MGAFLVRGNIEEVYKVVRKQLESQDFKISEEPNLSSSHNLLARRESEHLCQNTEARLRLTPYKDITVVDARFQMGLFGRIRLLIPLVSLCIIVLFLVLYLEQFIQAITAVAVHIIVLPTGFNINTPFQEQPGCCVILTIMFILIVPTMTIILRLETGQKKNLSAVSTEFWDALKKTFVFVCLHLQNYNLLQ